MRQIQAFDSTRTLNVKVKLAMPKSCHDQLSKCFRGRRNHLGEDVGTERDVDGAWGEGRVQQRAAKWTV